MTGLLGAVAPTALREQVAREAASFAAQDLAAAAYIDEAAAFGDDAAVSFKAEAEGHLTEASVRRARARRLRDGAAQAATMGFDRLAAMGADAALAEDLEAQTIEHSVVHAVRESHTPGVSLFGHLSDSESRLLQQKDRLSQMTSGETERAFSSLLNQLNASASNFGAADEDDSEELGCDAASRLGVAAQSFGGDLPSVLGDDCFVRMGGVLKATTAQLKKRLARKKLRLQKVEKTLEDLEAQGKKGLQVKLAQFRINTLEKSIARIEDKLSSSENGASKVLVMFGGQE